ncbi:SPW repeat protein [Pseudonocardia eucalypti]|uniref:SPW repeat protein n=1 Tax=Pseudonocardia eucalypti TaxID=648755 RepID=A0ABP9Q679_9PSEU|nr:hypothetical protein [Pseudonocardia eucalypti]
MKAWTRWQDWAVAVVGAYAALCPLWTITNDPAMTSLIVLGVLLVLASLWSLAQPGAVSSEYVHIALGVLMFVAPWVLGYSMLTGASWTSWVVGVLAAGLGLWALPESNKAHHAAMGH